jgi:hypothetical protein
LPIPTMGAGIAIAPDGSVVLMASPDYNTVLVI